MEDRDQVGLLLRRVARKRATGEPSSAGRFEAACLILEHIETMLDLASTAGFPAGVRQRLLDARIEAEQVIRDEGPRVTS